MKNLIKGKSRRYNRMVIVLIPCMILAGSVGWLVASSSGLQWLASTVERQSGGKVSANGISGSLIDSFGLQRLVILGEGWRITIQDIQVKWEPAALLSGQLKLLQLSARQIEVLSLSSDKTFVLPENLNLPLEMNVQQMKVASLQILSKEGAAPDFLASDIEARFISDAGHFQLQALRAHLPYGDFAGSGEVASVKPYALNARASLDTSFQISGRSELAHFLAEADGDFRHINVKLDGDGAGMRVNGTAQLVPFSAVPVKRLQIAFSGMDTGRVFEGSPSAVLSGNINLHGTTGGELEGSLRIHNFHAATLDNNGLPLRSMTSQVRLSSSHMLLHQLDVALSNDGHITGSLSWKMPNGSLEAQLKVHDLNAEALDKRLPGSSLQGDILLYDVDGDQHARIALSDGKLDLSGVVERHGDQIKLSGLHVAHGKSAFTGQGQLVMDRRRTFHFSGQLRKLDMSEFSAAPPTDLNAELEVSGTLLPEAEGTLQFNLSDGHISQYGINGNGHIEFSGTRHAVGKLSLNMGSNHLALEMTLGRQADLVQLVLDAPNLEQLGNGLSGKLAGQANLSGSPAEPRLQFTTQGSDIRLPGGQKIATLVATGDLSQAAMQMKLVMMDYRGTGSLNIPETRVELEGSLAHHTLRAFTRIAQDENAIGDLTLKANGGLNGSLPNWKALQWRGQIDDLSAQGVLPFRLSAAVPLSLAADSILLDAADVAIAGGQIRFSDTQWTPRRWHSSGHFSGINVRAVNMQQNISVPDIPEFMRTFDTMRIGGEWDATSDGHLQGQLNVHRESGDWVVAGNTDLHLGLRNMKLSLSASQDQLHADLDASGERLGEVKFQARVPLSHTEAGWTILPDAPLAGHLHVHSDDLSWLGPALDSNLQSGGHLDFAAGINGTLLSPRLQGAALGGELNLALLDQGIRLEHGELKARFESDSVYIDRFVFSTPYRTIPSDKLFGDYDFPSGTGELSANGSINLKGNNGSLQITAEHLPLAQRNDRWIIASGTGNVHYTDKKLLLDGSIRADAGFINRPVSDRPRFSDDVQIAGEKPVSRTGPPTAVNATLELGDHFYIRASGLEGRLTGQLKVNGEPGEPLHVNGIIAAQDAMYYAYGQRLEVERGILNFQGLLDDPGLNILALRKGLDVEAGVQVTGTARRPLVRLVSTPNVPDAEKLSWIILGHVPESDGVDSSILLAAAGSILGGQSGGQLGQKLGVDEISLSQKSGEGSQQIQKVTVGKQLSPRARISYEQSLNEVGGITKFTYTLTPRITVVTRTGTEDALDLFYTFRFY